jgi:hypothetical protein
MPMAARWGEPNQSRLRVLQSMTLGQRRRCAGDGAVVAQLEMYTSHTKILDCMQLVHRAASGAAYSICAERTVAKLARTPQFERHIRAHMIGSGCPSCCHAWGVFRLHPVSPSHRETAAFASRLWDQEGAFARAVVPPHLPRPLLTERALQWALSKPNSSIFCVGFTASRRAFKQGRWWRCITDSADRSDRSFQMIGPEILYVRRVTIESRSPSGAMAIFADPWMRGGDPAPPGECA